MIRSVIALLLCLTSLSVQAGVSFDTLSQLTNAPEALQGDFRQEKTLQQFATTISSSGTFSYQRNQFIRWLTTSPVENELVMTPSEITSRQNDQQLMHIDAADNPTIKVLNQIFFAVLTAEWKTLEAFFEADGQQDGDTWQVVLTPKEITLQQAVTTVELTGDRLLREMVLHEKNGDITHLYFSNLTEQ